jgi:GT2 family glycosyltransferase
MQRASIIIPVYNGYPYLEACLDSVKAEISSQDEVIVVDNASPDESVSLITQKFPWVRLILSQDNLGFAAACNLGAKKAIGDVRFVKLPKSR